MPLNENYKNKTLYYTIKGFENDKIRHLFSSRIGWNQNSIFKSIENIFGIQDKNIYRITQVHGDKVLIVGDQNFEEIKNIQADGLLTNRKGLALSTYHADCVPIYFHDEDKEIIGLAHAGWKGTLENISKNMIGKMIREFNCELKDIKVAIGPSICVDCYEIKEDVSTLFKNKYNEKDILDYKNNKIYLDLWKTNEMNLLEIGILKENISISGFCTSCNIDKLYSYRRENGTKNRMVASIMMKN